MPPNPAPGSTQAVRSAFRLCAIVAGVALCVKAGANLLIPSAYLVAVFAFERQPSTCRYLLALCAFGVFAIAIGAAFSVLGRRLAADGILLACGLILASIGRLHRTGR
jgi:hypothetical protein